MHIDIGNETKQIESIVNKSAFNQRRTAVKKKKETDPIMLTCGHIMPVKR